MNDKRENKDIDEVTGVETTGHEWDGLKELNNPLPRWWLWIFYVTILWSIGYWVVYPAWPTLSGNTQGISGRNQFTELRDSQREIIERQRVYLDKFEGAEFKEIMNDPELYAFAMAGGASAFKDNCATCHGTGGAGAPGYPNLNDDDWLWGGTLSDIHQTIKFGIRENNYDTRMSQMPAFGKDKLLNKEEIESVVDYVLSLSGGKTYGHQVQGLGVYKAQCASCHGDNGKGLQEFGAPNLTDKIWLYGGDRHSIYQTVYKARSGMMPAWGERLDKNTIKQLAVYLHQLGGGEEEPDDVSEKPKPAE